MSKNTHSELRRYSGIALASACESVLNQHLHATDIRLVIDVDAAGSSFSVDVERVQGVNLVEIIRHLQRTKERLPLHIALGIIRGACSDLKTPDGRDLIHGQISPQRVQVTSDGVTRLTGLVFSRSARRLARGHDRAYGSPDPYDQPDTHCDVFALSALLWELTTGRRLREQDAHSSTERRPSLVRAHYPPALEETVMRGLAHDRGHRFADPAALGDALAACEGIPSCHPAELSRFVQSVFDYRNRDDYQNNDSSSIYALDEATEDTLPVRALEFDAHATCPSPTGALSRLVPTVMCGAALFVVVKTLLF